jgi:hypothetical protein
MFKGTIQRIELSDEATKPISDSIGWYKCSTCEFLHLRLYAKNGELMATSVISREMIENMLSTIDGPPTVIYGVQ